MKSYIGDMCGVSGGLLTPRGASDRAEVVQRLQEI